MQRFVLVGILCLSTWAHAGDTKAWTAAKKVLPGSFPVVVGVNVSTLRGSDLYKQLMPVVLAQKADVESHMKEIKDTCGNDVTALVDSVVVGADEDGKVEMVVALRSWAQKDVESCFGKMAKAHSTKLVTEKAGDFTHYQYGDKDVYMRWLAKDTVLIAHAKDAPTGGGITAEQGLAPLLAGVKPDAAAWMVVNKTQPVPQTTAKATGMFMTADVKAGNVVLDVHVLLDSEKGAADLATKLTSMVPLLTMQVPKMANLTKSMTFKANGKEIVMTASDTEKDVAAIVTDMLQPSPSSPSSPSSSSPAAR